MYSFYVLCAVSIKRTVPKYVLPEKSNILFLCTLIPPPIEGIRAVRWAFEVGWAQTSQTHLQSTHFFTLIRNLTFLNWPCYIKSWEICLYFCRNLRKIEGAEKSLLQISDFVQPRPKYSQIRPFPSKSGRLWFNMIQKVKIEAFLAIRRP